MKEGHLGAHRGALLFVFFIGRFTNGVSDQANSLLRDKK
jgi:hypothetical protein